MDGSYTTEVHQRLLDVQISLTTLSAHLKARGKEVPWWRFGAEARFPLNHDQTEFLARYFMMLADEFSAVVRGDPPPSEYAELRAICNQVMGMQYVGFICARREYEYRPITLREENAGPELQCLVLRLFEEQLRCLDRPLPSTTFSRRPRNFKPSLAFHIDTLEATARVAGSISWYFTSDVAAERCGFEEALKWISRHGKRCNTPPVSSNLYGIWNLCTVGMEQEVEVA